MKSSVQLFYVITTSILVAVCTGCGENSGEKIINANQISVASMAKRVLSGDAANVSADTITVQVKVSDYDWRISDTGKEGLYSAAIDKDKFLFTCDTEGAEAVRKWLNSNF